MFSCGDAIERIQGGDALIAIVVRGSASSDATTFVTGPEASLQLGLIVYPAGGEVPRHTHLPHERRLTGTAEVLLVRSGRCEVDLYDDERQLVASRVLRGRRRGRRCSRAATGFACSRTRCCSRSSRARITGRRREGSLLNVIPVSEPWLGERERAYVDAVHAVRLDLVRRRASSNAFEAGWAAYCGRRYGISVSNGTVAAAVRRWRLSTSSRAPRSSCLPSRSCRARPPRSTTVRCPSSSMRIPRPGASTPTRWRPGSSARGPGGHARPHLRPPGSRCSRKIGEIAEASWPRR